MSPKLREQEREAGECWPCSARADYPLWPDSSLTWIRLTAQLTQLSRRQHSRDTSFFKGNTMFTSRASSLCVVLISSRLNFNARMSLLTKRCVKRAWVAMVAVVGGGVWVGGGWDLTLRSRGGGADLFACVTL